ncbi:hypothetical protein O0I10_006332 [Lichtheimia ornata]|uniref:Uncharacterized protein n=1 Tax=Lichtheimia ornata TaxID=688661 RepID=A0AAD7V5M8_9FUNG|nr:uncharacterized protein O0I10_006332 [Lichtheimia ornata]KAJ8658061.1 hypothetical protein O0I10_006332 [Lichtheimia ornata]
MPGYAIPPPPPMCYFSGESIHEDPVLFLEEFHRSATTRNSLSDKLKYQLLDHHLKGEVLDWFRKEGKKDLPFDDGTLNCFVQRFLSRFLTEERRNQM